MAKKITSLKPIIVLILGILFPLYIAVSHILYFIYDPPILYLTSTFIQYSCMATAMILITFRKRIPALVLTILALLIMFFNQSIPPDGDMDPIFRTLYYILEYVLLIVYILIRDDQKRNSLIWWGLFILATGYSIFEIVNYLTIKSLIHLILYLSLYLVGYSPDKWYIRKKVQESIKT